MTHVAMIDEHRTKYLKHEQDLSLQIVKTSVGFLKLRLQAVHALELQGILLS